MFDKKELIWLSILGLSNVKTSKLLNCYGDIYNLWNVDYDDLMMSKILTDEEIARLMDLKKVNVIEDVYCELKNKGVEIDLVNEDFIIERLNAIESKPNLLYRHGNLIKEDNRAIAIIGARRCTQYGMEIAYNLARDLAKYGFTIVSGMAEGIDSFAHRGALSAGGRTIGVLGCGVDVCYPKSNKKLMGEIINNGCILSEYALGET